MRNNDLPGGRRGVGEQVANQAETEQATQHLGGDHEELGPDLPRLHWAVPDPVRVDTDAAFEAAYTDISRRVRHLSSVYDNDQKAS
jgi:hypothetical protein